MLHTLLDGTLTLGGLFEAAASGAPPAQANAWLQAHVKGCLMRSAASLARTVAEQYKLSAPEHQQVPALRQDIPMCIPPPETSAFRTAVRLSRLCGHNTRAAQSKRWVLSRVCGCRRPCSVSGSSLTNSMVLMSGMHVMLRRPGLLRLMVALSGRWVLRVG